MTNETLQQPQTPERKSHKEQLTREELTEMGGVCIAAANRAETDLATVEHVESEAERQRQDIDTIFDTRPELGAIGTKEQYESYLLALFPDSKMRDIVYHGTASQFEEFNTRPTTQHKSRFVNEASFFTPDFSLANSYKGDGGEVKRVMLNIPHPKVYRKKSEGGGVDMSVPRSVTKDVREGLQAQGYDSIMNARYDDEIGVFEADTILTLGSNKDVEQFAQFVDTQE